MRMSLRIQGKSPIPIDFANVPSSKTSQPKAISTISNISNSQDVRRSDRLRDKHKLVEKERIPQLPDDIIRNVFEFVAFQCRFVCLLVSRRWCRLMIPIIWRTPFATKYIKYPWTGGKFWLSDIIATYISCLDPQSKFFLRQHGIKIPHSKKPLFQYQKFLYEFHLPQLEKVVINWYSNSQNIDQDLKYLCWHWREPNDQRTKVIKRRIMLLMTEISKLLFNSAYIKRTDFTIQFNSIFVPPLDTFNRFLKFSEDITFLKICNSDSNINFPENLRESTNELLCSMNSSFHNLYYIDITGHDVLNPLIISLIKNQKHLNSLVIRWARVINPILKILSSNTFSTLSWLGFDMVHVRLKTFQLLSACKNLESLVLYNVMELHAEPEVNIPWDLERPLSIKKLFIFDDGRYATNIRPSFIEIFRIVKESLQELTIDILYPHQSRDIISAMMKTCTNIKYLALHIKQIDTTDEFNKWLQFSKLQSLILKSKFNNKNFGTYIQELSEFFPESLTYLDLDSFITPKELELLLRSTTHVNFKKIGLNSTKGITDEHLHILMKYSEFYKSLEEVTYDRWVVQHMNRFDRFDRRMMFTCNNGLKFSELSDEKMEKAGRFIKIIRKEQFLPFENPLTKYHDYKLPWE
ncbi:45664_t:CDS:1 [Gigaspora margarita]|uniref:45664_t:CDS:1 n=1 Tax=Gigaspora margarita TaxID=4874 RepID=A0ABN7UD29_GIGMA|nr:45664_t:CDS:1 [Gigaspora margarita]